MFILNLIFYNPFFTIAGHEPEIEIDPLTQITEQDQMPQANIDSFINFKENGKKKNQTDLNSNQTEQAQKNSSKHTETADKTVKIKELEIKEPENQQNSKNQQNTDKSENTDSKVLKNDENQAESDENKHKQSETPEIVKKPEAQQISSRKVENEIRNYAADSCGSKIIEYSHGENAKALLDSNQDNYLKAKCDALPLRFVIELCEPIQIKEIRLGNCELFSSGPRNFLVSVSDQVAGLTSKSWVQIDQEFKAEDKHKVQVFPINVDSNINENYYKYVMFEIMDKYGDEIFCPLTFAGVFGKNWLLVESEIKEDENEEKDSEEVGENVHEKKDKIVVATEATPGIVDKLVNGVKTVADTVLGNPSKTEPKTNDPEPIKKVKNKPITYLSLENFETSKNAQLSTCKCQKSSIFNSFSLKSCEKYISSVEIQPKIVVKQNIIKTEDSHRNSGAKTDVKTDGTKKERVAAHPKIIKIVEKTDPKPDSSSKTTQNGSPSDPKLENTKKTKTESSNTKTTETPSPPTKQPNKEMHRPENVVMLFNNRLKKLEDELTVTTAYLEQLSNSYMVQMDGIRAVHNRTLIRLTNHIETTTQNITTLSKQMQIHGLKMEKEFEKLGRQSFWMKNRLDRFQIEKRRNSSKLDMKKIERWLSIIQDRIGESVSNRMSTDMQEQLMKYDKFNFEKILQHINYNDILVILLLSQFILNIFLKFLGWCFGKIASSCLVVMSLPVKAIRKRRKTVDNSSKTESVVSKIRNLSHRSSSGRKSLKPSKSLPKIVSSQFNDDSRIETIDMDKLMSILTRIERLERSMIVRKRAGDSFSDQLGALRVISRSEPGKELAKISQEISHRTILRKQNGEETTQDEMTLDEDMLAF